MADMAITDIKQLSNDNNVIKTLYYDHSNSTTAKIIIPGKEIKKYS